MPPEYVSIRILPEAKEAIMRAANKHETMSGTIIRICDHYTESQHTPSRELDTDKWKKDFEEQIAELRDSIQRLTPPGLELEQICQAPVIDLTQGCEPVIETIEPSAPSIEKEENVPDVQDNIATMSHTTADERRPVSDREKELFATICRKGTDIEGKQLSFAKKVDISNISVVKNLVNTTNTKGMYMGDIVKLIDYARSHCPELLKEYIDVMQQYE